MQCDLNTKPGQTHKVNGNPAEVLLRFFELFARLAFRHLHNGRELGHEPYVTYICGRLATAKNPGARIVINLPPRHLKTELAAVLLPAWLLARNPVEKIIILTYSEQLAADIAYKLRKILQSPWFTRYFPTRLAKDRTRASDFVTTAGGAVFSTSVDGSVTGRGASIIIFDDPLKIADAGNLTQIEKVNHLFDAEIMTRLDEPKTGRVIINAHRLHQDDLSGHVLQGEEFDGVVLPFIAPADEEYDLGDGRVWRRKKGELLRPNAFAQADVDRLRESIINPDFEALYQQFRGEGFSFSMSESAFGTFTIDPPPDAAIVISVDPGHRPGPGHSYTVCQAWCRLGNEFLFLDQWRRQADLDAASRALKIGTLNCQPTVVLIEDTGYGSALHRDLRRRFPRLDLRLICRTVVRRSPDFFATDASSSVGG